MDAKQTAEQPVVDSANEALLTTGDMARVTGNTLRTVRFYEESGILTPHHRSPGGHRLFGKQQLERLHFVSDMRATGMSLEDIRSLLSLKDGATDGALAAESTAAALDVQLSALDEKIALLGRVRQELQGARRILQRCRDCKNERCFPDACGDCEVIRSEPEVPQSMRVLWGVRPSIDTA